MLLTKIMPVKVRDPGLEPGTSRLSVERSNQSELIAHFDDH